MGPQADFDFWFESKTDSTDWKLNRFFFFFSQCAFYFISLVPKEIENNNDPYSDTIFKNTFSGANAPEMNCRPLLKRKQEHGQMLI